MLQRSGLWRTPLATILACSILAGIGALYQYARGQVAVGTPTITALQTVGNHIAFAGGAPVAAGGANAAGSTDTAGTFTAAAASGSITFSAPYAAAPTCLIADSSATPIIVYTVSTTAITLTTLTSGHVYQYLCFGKAGG